MIDPLQHFLDWKDSEEGKLIGEMLVKYSKMDPRGARSWEEVVLKTGTESIKKFVKDNDNSWEVVEENKSSNEPQENEGDLGDFLHQDERNLEETIDIIDLENEPIKRRSWQR
jgi:hypothetical protein